MKERPILFSAPMVREILAGTKTQTRRVWKLPRGCSWYAGHGGEAAGMVQDDDGPAWWHVSEQRCPYGRPGDRLWVRECWGFEKRTEDDPRLEPVATYRADDAEHIFPVNRWRPSIHMPRHLSRITLEVTGVRVERLQDINEADAIAEGIEPAAVPDSWRLYGRDTNGDMDRSPRVSYRSLWESLHGPNSWDTNPWVWVVEFRRLDVARLLDA